MTPPTVGRCDLPGHDHLTYREPIRSNAAYRVGVWMSWADVDADRPRAITYHDDAASAWNQYDGWSDAPIAEIIDLRERAVRAQHADELRPILAR